MRISSHKKHAYESSVYNKLHEAEIQAAGTAERFSHEEVMAAAQLRLRSGPGGGSEQINLLTL